MYVAQIKTGSGYYDILLLLLLLLHTRFVHKNCAKDYGTTLQDLQLPTLLLSPLLVHLLTHAHTLPFALCLLLLCSGCGI